MMSEKTGRISYDYPKSKKFIDRTGEFFGHWLVDGFSHQVIHEAASGKINKTIYWNCTCTNCGKVSKAIAINNLTSGKSTSCGCAVTREDAAEKRLSVRPGDRIGLLEVVERKRGLEKHQPVWLVKCHGCGKHVTKETQDVKRVRSCGHYLCHRQLKQLGEEASKQHTFGE